VKKLLIDAGYSYDGSKEKDMLSSHYHLVFQKDEYVVEVHWNLVKRYFDIPPEFWWEDTYHENYNGRSILCLSPEKYLISMIFRLFSHTFSPFKFCVLTSELCNKYYEAVNWPSFIEVTKEYGMERLTVFTLKLLNELLGTRVPDLIMNKRVFGYDFFKKSTFNQLFGDAKRPFITKPLYVFLLDSPFGIAAYFIKRLFPEASELKLRYGIPNGSSAMLVYYVFNPVLLPLLLLKKRRDSKYSNSPRIGEG
jgi:hypothetical protein